MTDLSRRALLAGAASAAVLGLPAMSTASTAEADPDAEFFALYRAWVDARTHSLQACRDRDALMERFYQQRPPCPSELTSHPALCGVRSFEITEERINRAFDEMALLGNPSLIVEAHRGKCLAILATWEVEKDRLRQSLCLDRLEAKSADASIDERSAFERLMGSPAATVSALALKLLAGIGDAGELDQIDEDGGGSDERAFRAIAHDLLRLAGDGPRLRAMVERDLAEG